MGQDNTNLDYICQLIIWSINTAIPQRDVCHLIHIFNQAVYIFPLIVCISFIILAFCFLYYTLQGHSISSYPFLKTQIDGISIYLLNIYCQGFQCQKLGTKTKYVFYIKPYLCKFLVFQDLLKSTLLFFLYCCHILKKCCSSPTILWLSVLSNIQLTIGNSYHMIFWWPMVKYSVYYRVQHQTIS